MYPARADKEYAFFVGRGAVALDFRKGQAVVEVGVLVGTAYATFQSV